MEDSISGCSALGSLGKERDAIYHDIAVRMGMPDSAMAVLYTLCEEGEGLTPTELYNVWSLSKQTGHSALMWLEKRGFVKLAPAPEDRRSKRVYLTPAGEEYVDRTIRPLLRAEEAAFQRLTDREQQMLVELTGKITQYLKEETAGLLTPPQEL